MRKTLSAAAVVLTLFTGCYAGRTPTKKTAAYVTNTFGLLGGSALIAAGVSASHSADSSCDGVNEGTACGFGSIGDGIIGGGLTVIGGSMIAASIAMTILTLAVPTESEPVPVPTTAQRPAATGVVTTPGLPSTNLAGR
jgi:hypothetical protein